MFIGGLPLSHLPNICIYRRIVPFEFFYHTLVIAVRVGFEIRPSRKPLPIFT